MSQNNIVLSDVTFNKFPNGEVVLNEDGFNHIFNYSEAWVAVVVDKPIDDIVTKLLQVCEYVKLKGFKISLYFHYLPFARYDRSMSEVDINALKWFGKLISNMVNPEMVYLIDPHSDVAEAVFDCPVNIIKKKEIWDSSFFGYNPFSPTSNIENDRYIVSPDLGAVKETYELAKEFQYKNIAIATKVRELSTGKIIASDIDVKDFEGKDVDVFDDICDGGRTFIELAKKMNNTGKKRLFITHGFFTNAEQFEELNKLYDEVYYLYDYR
ncbi:hypothetical protein [uncultured Arcobacter sp.]|uniref:hypothetical protein n=1 Tax=uncultured Arcobacter sp. TaxID=165434 RepID=UPI00260B096C|nr:hypothetical protein [uncultured Arcobacter sp.]